MFTVSRKGFPHGLNSICCVVAIHCRRRRCYKESIYESSCVSFSSLLHELIILAVTKCYRKIQFSGTKILGKIFHVGKSWAHRRLKSNDFYEVFVAIFSLDFDFKVAVAIVDSQKKVTLLMKKK